MAKRQWLLPGISNAPLEFNTSTLSAILREEVELFTGRMVEKGVNIDQVRQGMH